MRSKKAVLKNPDPALYVIFSIFIAFTHFSGCSFFSSSLTFCIYDISHCCQAGKKNIGWSCSEACVGCSWKSSALVVTRNKPKSPMLGTPACSNILTAGLKPPQQDLPAQILSKCSCYQLIAFLHVICFHIFLRFPFGKCHRYPAPTHHAANRGPILQMVWDNWGSPNLFEWQISRVTLPSPVPHIWKEQCETILRCPLKMWAPWGRHQVGITTYTMVCATGSCTGSRSTQTSW